MKFPRLDSIADGRLKVGGRKWSFSNHGSMEPNVLSDGYGFRLSVEARILVAARFSPLVTTG